MPGTNFVPGRVQNSPKAPLASYTTEKHSQANYFKTLAGQSVWCTPSNNRPPKLQESSSSRFIKSNGMSTRISSSPNKQIRPPLPSGIRHTVGAITPE